MPTVFPDVGRSWYEEGLERVLATLSTTFQSLADGKLLHVGDPLLAANHFVGLLLWIPINRAMFTGITAPATMNSNALLWLPSAPSLQDTVLPIDWLSDLRKQEVGRQPKACQPSPG
jgi:AefR-like transcriptional repressor, C-terminal domain